MLLRIDQTTKRKMYNGIGCKIKR